MPTDLSRFESNERVDLGDFGNMIDGAPQALIRQPNEEFLTDPGGAVKSWIIDGFAMSDLGAGQLKITKGRALLAQREGAEIHYGALTTEGDASKTLDLSGYGNGTYDIYIRFQYVDAETQSRMFWNPSGSGTEFAQSIQTRRQANWSMRVELASPGDEWTKIGTVEIAGGVIGGAGIVDERNFYFEGKVSDTYANTWGSSPDRDATRAADGIKDLQTFTAAVRTLFEDLRPSGGRWWEARGLAATGKAATNEPGFDGTADGTGPGVKGTASGASDTSVGLEGLGDVSGAANTSDGVKGTGAGTDGHGVVGTGAATGPGVIGTGGATSGRGIEGVGGAPNGYGGHFQGTGSGEGINANGGSSDGDGVVGNANGSGNGVVGLADLTGVGVEGVGGATSGTGVTGTGMNGNALGVAGFGQGSASGVAGTGGGTDGTGVTGTGGGTDGGGVFGAGKGTGIGVYGLTEVGGTGIAVYGYGGNGEGYGVVAQGKTNPSASGRASLRIFPQTTGAPASLDDGAVWIIGAAMYVRLSGVTKTITVS